MKSKTLLHCVVRLVKDASFPDDLLPLILSATRVQLPQLQAEVRVPCCNRPATPPCSSTIKVPEDGL